MLPVGDAEPSLGLLSPALAAEEEPVRIASDAVRSCSRYDAGAAAVLLADFGELWLAPRRTCLGVTPPTLPSLGDPIPLAVRRVADLGEAPGGLGVGEPYDVVRIAEISRLARSVRSVASTVGLNSVPAPKDKVTPRGVSPIIA